MYKRAPPAHYHNGNLYRGTGVLHSLALAEEENARLGHITRQASEIAASADAQNVRSQAECARLSVQLNELKQALDESRNCGLAAKAQFEASSAAAESAYTEQAARAEAAIERLRDRVLALEAEREQLSRQLTICRAEKTAAAEAARKVEYASGAETARLLERATSAESARVEASRKRDEALDEVDRLRRALEQERLGRSRCETISEKAAGEVTSLTANSARLRASSSALEAEVAALERRLSTVGAKASELQRKADEAEARATVAEDEVITLRSNLAVMGERNSSVEVRHAAEAKALEERLVAAEGTARRIEGKYRHVQMDLERVSALWKEAAERADVQTDALRDAESRVARLHEEKGSLMARIDELEHRLDESRKKNERTEQARLEAADDAAAMRTALENARGILSRRAVEIARAEERANAAIAQRGTVEADLEAAQLREERAMAKFDQAQEEAQRARAAVEACEAQLASERGERRRMEALLEKTEEQLVAARQLAAAARDTADSHALKLFDAANEHSALQEHASSLGEALAVAQAERRRLDELVRYLQKRTAGPHKAKVNVLEARDAWEYGMRPLPYNERKLSG